MKQINETILNELINNHPIVFAILIILVIIGIIGIIYKAIKKD